MDYAGGGVCQRSLREQARQRSGGRERAREGRAGRWGRRPRADACRPSDSAPGGACQRGRPGRTVRCGPPARGPLRGPSRVRPHGGRGAPRGDEGPAPRTGRRRPGMRVPRGRAARVPHRPARGLGRRPRARHARLCPLRHGALRARASAPLPRCDRAGLLGERCALDGRRGRGRRRAGPPHGGDPAHGHLETPEVRGRRPAHHGDPLGRRGGDHPRASPVPRWGYRLARRIGTGPEATA